jgi:hypothetical protein
MFEKENHQENIFYGNVPEDIRKILQELEDVEGFALNEIDKRIPKKALKLIEENFDRLLEAYKKEKPYKGTFIDAENNPKYYSLLTRVVQYSIVRYYELFRNALERYQEHLNLKNSGTEGEGCPKCDLCLNALRILKLPTILTRENYLQVVKNLKKALNLFIPSESENNTEEESENTEEESEKKTGLDILTQERGHNGFASLLKKLIMFVRGLVGDTNLNLFWTPDRNRVLDAINAVKKATVNFNATGESMEVKDSSDMESDVDLSNDKQGKYISPWETISN